MSWVLGTQPKATPRSLPTAPASCFLPASHVGQKSEIRIMDLKTTQISTVSGSGGLFSPRWSPDGRYLAALDLEELSKTLRIFDFQTGKWSDWATEPVYVGYPAWTSDSRYVEYSTHTEVKQIKVVETHPETLFCTKGFHRD